MLFIQVYTLDDLFFLCSKRVKYYINCCLNFQYEMMLHGGHRNTFMILSKKYWKKKNKLLLILNFILYASIQFIILELPKSWWLKITKRWRSSLKNK